MNNPYRLQHLRRFANGLSVGLVRASARASGGADPWADLFASVRRSLSGAKAAEAARQAAATADRSAAALAPAAPVEAAKPKPIQRRSAAVRPLPTALSFPRPIGTDVRAVQFFAGLPFSGPPRNAAVVTELPTRAAGAPRLAAPVDADQRAGNLFRSLAWDGATTKERIHIEPGSVPPGSAPVRQSDGPDLPAEFAPSRVFAAGAASFLQSVPWDAVPRSDNTQASS
jgi:hypothetical protein